MTVLLVYRQVLLEARSVCCDSPSDDVLKLLLTWASCACFLLLAEACADKEKVLRKNGNAVGTLISKTAIHRLPSVLKPVLAEVRVPVQKQISARCT